MSHAFIRPPIQEMLDTFAADSDADLFAASQVDLDYDPQTAWPQGGPRFPGVIGALQVEEQMAEVVPIPTALMDRAMLNAAKADEQPRTTDIRRPRRHVAGFVLLAGLTIGTGIYALYQNEVSANEYRQKISDCMSEIRGFQLNINANTPDNAGNLVADDPASALIQAKEDQMNSFGTFNERNAKAEKACETAHGDPARAEEIIVRNR